MRDKTPEENNNEKAKNLIQKLISQIEDLIPITTSPLFRDYKDLLFRLKEGRWLDFSKEILIARLCVLINLNEQDPFFREVNFNSIQRQISEIIIGWLSAHAKVSKISVISADDLLKIFNVMKTDRDIFIITEAWLKATPRVSTDDLVKILNVMKTDHYRSTTIEKWLEATPDVPADDLIKILVGFKDNAEKTCITAQWLEKNPNFTADDLIKILVGFKDNAEKRYITAQWLEKNPNATVDGIIKILDAFREGIYKEILKETIIQKWLKGGGKENKYNSFLTFAQKGYFGSIFNENGFKEIANIWRQIYPLDKSTLEEQKQIIQLCKDLYPNSEYMQSELFLTFVSKSYVTVDNNEILKDFLSTLQSVEEITHILTRIPTAVKPTEKEMLQILGDRLSNKYKSLSSILNIPLKEGLTVDGLAEVVYNFGLEPKDWTDKEEIKDQEVKGQNPPAQGRKINLAGLFSYYSIYGGLQAFQGLLKPDVLAKMQQNFRPTDSQAFMLEEEVKNLQALLGPNAVKVPKISVLGTYLATKTKAIPVVDTKTYQMNFEDCPWLERQPSADSAKPAPEIKEKEVKIPPSEQLESKATKDITQINQQFKQLLSKEVTAEEITDFFKNLLQFDTEINPLNKQKLKDLFNDNKNEIAYLFAQKGGVAQFAALFGSINDGCVANIASQVKNIIYKMLLESPIDQILYAFYVEKIATPILNRGGDHLTANAKGTDIFTSRKVVEHYISVPGLINKLKENFLGKERTIEPIDFVAQISGTTQGIVYDILCKKCPQGITYNESEAAELAVYYLLKNTTPEILLYCEKGFVEKYSKVPNTVSLEQRKQDKQAHTTAHVLIDLPWSEIIKIERKDINNVAEHKNAQEVKNIGVPVNRENLRRGPNQPQFNGRSWEV